MDYDGKLVGKWNRTRNQNKKLYHKNKTCQKNNMYANSADEYSLDIKGKSYQCPGCITGNILYKSIIYCHFPFKITLFISLKVT